VNARSKEHSIIPNSVLWDYVRVLQENARFRAQLMPVKMEELGPLAYVVCDCKKNCVRRAKSLPQLHSKGMCLLAQLKSIANLLDLCSDYS
jgi:hypothetical protein